MHKPAAMVYEPMQPRDVAAAAYTPVRTFPAPAEPRHQSEHEAVASPYQETRTANAKAHSPTAPASSQGQRHRHPAICA